MFYDTQYRHDEALSPAALTTLTAALHALNKGVEDCQRAGKRIDRDAAILLLIRNLADVAERDAPSITALRARCTRDRLAIVAHPALLDIAGNDIATDEPAKRVFHYQVRRALRHLLAAIGLDPDDARINTMIQHSRDEGATELRHPEIAIRVVPRGLVLDGEMSFHRCRDGQDAGMLFRAPIAELVDPAAFVRRLSATIGALGTPLQAAA
ncbi:ankyrin repeat protein [Sphingomonas sp. SORGH_AS 950]|uniref:hypothetical protein n=1 Tax=Sphingomonas sp. SORGH_AS_0950 TaxID=3041792 RepID=UPI00277D3069|nr:hypothetical protein [Sphingomonas sp. SORGH_AS_0950]MDQ1159534.1 ankyrin repeat protein [Sphingomonas sp. SORGH_AS_0950]